MKELENSLINFLTSLGVKPSVKKKKIVRQPSEMELMIDLKNNELIIDEYLQGFSTEEICLKNNISFKNVDKIIDCYNYLYN